jgi:hypothetical protein
MPKGRLWIPIGPALLLAAGAIVGIGAWIDPGVRAAQSPQRAPGVAGCEAGAATGAWFQLDERADSRAALVGYTLRVGSGPQAWGAMSLPPESFAAGPFGGVVLVGSDDGRR